MNTTQAGLSTSSILLPAALLVAADRNSGLDPDERMSVLEAVMAARDSLRLPEEKPVAGAYPLDEDDRDENPTTRAYRTILEASEEDLGVIVFDDEFLWNDEGGNYAVGILEDEAILATRHEIIRLTLTPVIEFDEHPLDEFFQAENPEGTKILWRTPDGSETYPDSEVWWIDSQLYLVEEQDLIVGFERRDEFGNPEIVCVLCATDLSVPVRQSQIAPEGELCAATDYASPEAHWLFATSDVDLTQEGTLDADLDPDGLTVAHPVAERAHPVVEAERRVAAAQPLLANVIWEVSAACERHNVDGYDGEAVSYLSALLHMAQHPEVTADEAVVWAYGIKDGE